MKWCNVPLAHRTEPTSQIRCICSVHILELTHMGDFYIHGSEHPESNLITVRQDAIYSVYYISVGSSTCFGC